MTTPAADASVRPAVPTDAPAVAATMAAFWRGSYASILPRSLLATLDVRSAAQDWRRSIANPPTPRHAVLVACEGAAVVGYAVAAPAGTPGATAGSVGELVDLVVHPDHQRAGHGSRLLAAAVDHLRGHGYGEVVTWVAEPDELRRRFLREAGFAEDGGVRTLDMGRPGGPSLQQVRLGASLIDDAPPDPV